MPPGDSQSSKLKHELVAISKARQENLNAYRYRSGERNYWLTEMDIADGVLPLRRDPEVYVHPPTGESIAIVEAKIEKELMDGRRKIAFYFERVNIDGGHWQVHWWKNVEGKIKRETYNPPPDGLCGDRSFVNALQVYKETKGGGDTLHGIDLELFEYSNGAQRSECNERLRAQTIRSLREFSQVDTYGQTVTPEPDQKAWELIDTDESIYQQTFSSEMSSGQQNEPVKDDQEYKNWYRTIAKEDDGRERERIIKEQAQEADKLDKKGEDYHRTKLSVWGLFKQDQHNNPSENSNYKDWLQRQKEQYLDITTSQEEIDEKVDESLINIRSGI